MTIRKRKSLFGPSTLFVADDDRVGAANGFVAGGDGAKNAFQVTPSPATFMQFEDFVGTLPKDTGDPFPGSGMKALIGDTGNTNAITAAVGGVFRLLSTRSATPVRTPAGGVAIGGAALQYKANAGPGNTSGRLRISGRSKMLTVAQAEAAGNNRLHFFAGFTDVATFEFPAYDTGAGLIGTADDFVGIIYGGGDTGFIGAAGAGGTDQEVSLGVSPTANTYFDWAVEVTRGPSDTGGTATFYINNLPVGHISSPVTSTVALSPIVGCFAQDTGGNYLDIDYIAVEGTRDTGE